MADCIDQIIIREGGDTITDDPYDPGGVTKFGIAQKFHPNVAVATLTEPEARTIYEEEYLGSHGIGLLPDDALRCQVLDFAVTSGVVTAVRALQTVLHVTPDGVIGPATLAALRAADLKDVNNRLALLRMGAIYQLVRERPVDKKYRDGWLRRAKGFLLA